jgi:hypothetical protein
MACLDGHELGARRLRLDAQVVGARGSTGVHQRLNVGKVRPRLRERLLGDDRAEPGAHPVVVGEARVAVGRERCRRELCRRGVAGELRGAVRGGYLQEVIRQWHDQARLERVSIIERRKFQRNVDELCAGRKRPRTVGRRRDQVTERAVADVGDAGVLRL